MATRSCFLIETLLHQSSSHNSDIKREGTPSQGKSSTPCSMSEDDPCSSSTKEEQSEDELTESPLNPSSRGVSPQSPSQLQRIIANMIEMQKTSTVPAILPQAPPPLMPRPLFGSIAPPFGSVNEVMFNRAIHALHWNHAMAAVQRQQILSQSLLRSPKDALLSSSSRSTSLLPRSRGDGTNRGNVKKYRCDICEKTFSRSNTLITHKRIHTGEKPFKCDHCGRAFRQPGNLTRHRLTHTTVKPYVCSECDKAFNRASNLHTHMRTHARP